MTSFQPLMDKRNKALTVGIIFPLNNMDIASDEKVCLTYFPRWLVGSSLTILHTFSLAHFYLKLKHSNVSLLVM